MQCLVSCVLSAKRYGNARLSSCKWMMGKWGSFKCFIVTVFSREVELLCNLMYFVILVSSFKLLIKFWSLNGIGLINAPSSSWNELSNDIGEVYGKVTLSNTVFGCYWLFDLLYCLNSYETPTCWTFEDDENFSILFIVKGKYVWKVKGMLITTKVGGPCMVI